MMSSRRMSLGVLRASVVKAVGCQAVRLSQRHWADGRSMPGQARLGIDQGHSGTGRSLQMCATASRGWLIGNVRLQTSARKSPRCISRFETTARLLALGEPQLQPQANGNPNHWLGDLSRCVQCLHPDIFSTNVTRSPCVACQPAVDRLIAHVLAIICSLPSCPVGIVCKGAAPCPSINQPQPQCRSLPA